MGQIMRHQLEAVLQQTREDSSLEPGLAENLASGTGFKQKFQANPAAMMGIAFGGGILVATMMGRRKKRSVDRVLTSAIGAGAARFGTNVNKQKTLDYWNNVKGALIGVAASRLTNYVGNLIPGFGEHFKHTKEQSRPRPAL